MNLVSSRKSPLSLLDLSSQLLDSTNILAEILSLLFLVQLDEMLHHSLVKVLSSEMSVSIGGRNLESTTAEIEDENVLLSFLLVHTISNGSCCRFVDDPHNVKTSDDTGILCSLSLGVVEVSWYSHNGVGNLLTKVSLCSFLHLGEDHSRDFLSCESLLSLRCVDLDVRFAVLFHNLEREELQVSLHSFVIELSADQSLGVKDGVLGISCQLILGCISNQPFTISSEGNITGSNPVTLVISDDFNTPVLEDSNTGVSCSQIDPNHSS